MYGYGARDSCTCLQIFATPMFLTACVRSENANPAFAHCLCARSIGTSCLVVGHGLSLAVLAITRSTAAFFSKARQASLSMMDHVAIPQTPMTGFFTTYFSSIGRAWLSTKHGHDTCTLRRQRPPHAPCWQPAGGWLLEAHSLERLTGSGLKVQTAPKSYGY